MRMPHTAVHTAEDVRHSILPPVLEGDEDRRRRHRDAAVYTMDGTAAAAQLVCHPMTDRTRTERYSCHRRRKARVSRRPL